ncbi:small subunit ribosomal protein S19 [Geosmithia morbida]|uniref:Small subunit ribosomal protein S19 n=1 Tax=Geosmithia morbida TaxID=1094350 RepID=A0A9P5D0K8_9HYPO|nr:small subunit ribosomal protein S19 [Geosmithia morbida]KAF4119551.1 small subunit ribosomal protein S19 [Geosmithia morbida]
MEGAEPRAVSDSSPLRSNLRPDFPCLSHQGGRQFDGNAKREPWPKKQGDKPPPVRTNARSATILPSFVGLRFEVHNGKIYNRINITEDMVGHKLGEFSPTRKGVQKDKWKNK